MSAPMRNLFQRQFCKILNDNNLILQSSNRKCFKISQNRTFRTYADSFTRRISLKTGILGTVIVAGSFSIGNFVKLKTYDHSACDIKIKIVIDFSFLKDSDLSVFSKSNI